MIVIDYSRFKKNNLEIMEKLYYRLGVDSTFVPKTKLRNVSGEIDSSPVGLAYSWYIRFLLVLVPGFLFPIFIKIKSFNATQDSGCRTAATTYGHVNL